MLSQSSNFPTANVPITDPRRLRRDGWPGVSPAGCQGAEGSETSSTAAKKIWYRKLVIPSSHGRDVVAAPLAITRRSLRAVGAQSHETCWKVATVEFEESHRIAVDVDVQLLPPNRNAN
jgi:hypothetical protein